MGSKISIGSSERNGLFGKNKIGKQCPFRNSKFADWKSSWCPIWNKIK